MDSVSLLTLGDETTGGGGGGGAVGQLSVRDLDFVSDGAIVKLRAVTGFTFWQDFIAGELGKLDDFVGYFRERKFNSVRVFGCWGNTGFNPVHDPHNYELLAEADAWLNERGMRFYLTCFTDQVQGSSVLMDDMEQDAHIGNCLDALLRRRTARFEFVNEYRKNWEEPYPIRYPNVVAEGVVSTRSTWYDEHDPQEPGPYIDFLTKHTGGFDEEWSRKSKVVFEGQRQGLGPYPASRKPTVIGEKCRIAEGALPHEYAGATAIEEGLGSGGCLHGGYGPSRGHDSDLQHCSIQNMTQTAKDCIDAASSVFDVIRPETASQGSYSNGPGNGVLEHDDNKMLRTYVMTEGNRATAFRLQGHKSGQPIVPVNDWRVVDVKGWGDVVVFLER